MSNFFFEGFPKFWSLFVTTSLAAEILQIAVWNEYGIKSGCLNKIPGRVIEKSLKCEFVTDYDMSSSLIAN